MEQLYNYLEDMFPATHQITGLIDHSRFAKLHQFET